MTSKKSKQDALIDELRQDSNDPKDRLSEQRQALARTRYIYHDVDFYIISKDRVTEYEPFFSDIEVEPFMAKSFEDGIVFSHYKMQTFEIPFSPMTLV
jgi:hypothetical protein